MRAERAGEGALHRPCLAQRCKQPLKEDKNTAQPPSPLLLSCGCAFPERRRFLKPVATRMIARFNPRNLAYRLIVTCSSCSSGPLSGLPRGWPFRW